MEGGRACAFVNAGALQRLFCARWLLGSASCDARPQTNPPRESAPGEAASPWRSCVALPRPCGRASGPHAPPCSSKPWAREIWYGLGGIRESCSWRRWNSKPGQGCSVQISPQCIMRPRVDHRIVGASHDNIGPPELHWKIEMQEKHISFARVTDKSSDRSNMRYP